VTKSCECSVALRHSSPSSGSKRGNRLRRRHAGSLQEAAATDSRLESAINEFTTVGDVVEDVTDIILNVKSLVVKNLSDQPKTIRIQKHEAGAVRGVDVQHDETIQVINPEHHIATLPSEVPFVIEMTVENGRGYAAVLGDSPFVGADQVCKEAAVDDVGLGALDLTATEVDMPGLELADEEQVFEDLGVGTHGVGVQLEVERHRASVALAG